MGECTLRWIILCFFFSVPGWAFSLATSLSLQEGWDTKILTFNINYTSCTLSQDTLNTAIDKAIALWNSVPTSSLKLTRGGDSISSVTNAVNRDSPDAPVILCDQNLSTHFADLSADAVLAITLPKANTNTNKIVNGAMILNNENGKKADLSIKSDTILAITIAHEMGHILGLGHTSDDTALMYFSASKKTDVNLSQDDMDGITYLYPRNEIGGSKVFGCGSLGSNSHTGNPYYGIGLLLGLCFIIWITQRKTNETPSVNSQF